uniref:DUF6065 family protein n=1 Tax=Herbidospora sakaeratensis TaxID=564415 RepID=UPI000783AE8A|nr:DUF6065 family protein [Herbidospora sakaeratensis]
MDFSMRQLTAYALEPPHLPLEPAEVFRDWMNGTPDRYANRCLPMLIANQYGWHVLNRGTVRVEWNGGIDAADVSISADGWDDPPISNFGSGIVTWRIPYLFRTPPGWNLLVRGPANHIKGGAGSLEGIVETDWAITPAFHSWRLTDPGRTVVWTDGEPICSIVPQRRSDLERWDPILRELGSDPQLAEEYRRFAERRAAFSAAHPTGWEKDYFLGRRPGGEVSGPDDHQRRLRLRAFTPAVADGTQ